ncbi:hypothetical protein MESS4_750301 [Mesorhizobium sp. STM 4661]|nr:hypothetical protein MESS4_750301 [Mesorhizobium sp. STM 4661]
MSASTSSLLADVRPISAWSEIGGVESTSWPPSENSIKISHLRGRFGGGGSLQRTRLWLIFPDNGRKSGKFGKKAMSRLIPVENCT